MEAHHYLYFALAAAAGAFLRFACSVAVEYLSVKTHKKITCPTKIFPSKYVAPLFPWSIFIVNILGCFGFGLMLSLTQNQFYLSDEIRKVIFVGFFGAFTTYSTFIFEIYSLWKEGYYISCFSYLAGQIILGLSAFWLGSQFFS